MLEQIKFNQEQFNKEKQVIKKPDYILKEQEQELDRIALELSGDKSQDEEIEFEHKLSEYLETKKQELKNEIETKKQELPSSKFDLGSGKLNFENEIKKIILKHSSKDTSKLEKELEREIELKQKIQEMEIDLKMKITEQFERYQYEKKAGILSKEIKDFENNLKIPSLKLLTETFTKDLDKSIIEGQVIKEEKDKIENNLNYIWTCAEAEKSDCDNNEKEMLKAVYSKNLKIDPSLVLEFDGQIKYLQEVDLRSVKPKDIKKAKDIIDKEKFDFRSFIKKYGPAITAAGVLVTMLAGQAVDVMAQDVGQNFEQEDKASLKWIDISQAVLIDINKFKDQQWGQHLIESVTKNRVNKNPWIAIQYADKFKDQPYAQKIIETAAKRAAIICPDVVLEYADKFKDQPYARDVIETAAKRALSRYPELVLQYANVYKNQPYAQKIIETVVENKQWLALKYANKFGDQPYAQRIIETAAKNSRSAALFYASYYSDYLDKLALQEIIETAAKNDPQYALQEWSKIKEILQKSADPAIKALLEIQNNYDYYNSRQITLLFQEIVHNNLSIKDAYKITKDPDELFQSLVNIKSQPDHLCSYSVEKELSHLSLRKVRNINDLHNESDSIRFESVKNANSQELYTLMTYGEEEIFTSSFNGLFDRQFKSMDTENMSGDQLLEKMGHNKFRTFIKLCFGFNRLSDFLETMNSEAQKQLLEKFVKNIEQEKDFLSQAVTVAGTFSMLQNPEILKIMQETIKDEYERVKKDSNKQGEAIYGLLSGMFGETAIMNKAWFEEMSKKYESPNLTEIPKEKLFNPDGSNVQQYFFYDDRKGNENNSKRWDGHHSFKNMMAGYGVKVDYDKQGKIFPIQETVSNGWKTQDKGDFILISQKGNNGKQIEIYVNQPDKEDAGPEEIEKILKERNIKSIVVVHRGHSYHTHKTIERIPSIAQIVSLGSCGGYNNINGVLEKAPEAHIISTKGTGAMSVNDPMLKMLNEEICGGKNINWPEFWGKMEKKLGKNKDFKDYVPPHKNLDVMFLKAYNKLTK